MVGRGKAKKAREWGRTWEYCHVSADPLCSRLCCGTYYWCRRKFGPTGNKAASCPAPLRHYRRGMAGSGNGSGFNHRGPAPGMPKEAWSPVVEHINSLLSDNFGNLLSIKEKQRSKLIPYLSSMKSLNFLQEECSSLHNSSINCSSATILQV